MGRLEPYPGANDSRAHWYRSRRPNQVKPLKAGSLRETVRSKGDDDEDDDANAALCRASAGFALCHGPLHHRVTERFSSSLSAGDCGGAPGLGSQALPGSLVVPLTVKMTGCRISSAGKRARPRVGEVYELCQFDPPTRGTMGCTIHRLAGSVFTPSKKGRGPEAGAPIRVRTELLLEHLSPLPERRKKLP